MRNVLALLADWSDGIFAVLLASYFTQTELLWWHILVGILFAMSPDVDAIPEILRRGKVSASVENIHDHRTFLHWPVISIFFGLIAWMLFGYWGLVWLIALLLHLINDLYGTGWGIVLLWPFSKKRYKLLGRKVNRLKHHLIAEGDWDELAAAERKLRLVVSWSPSELPSYIKRWGQDDWISLWYLKLNWISFIEYALFLIACVLLIIYFV